MKLDLRNHAAMGTLTETQLRNAQIAFLNFTGRKKYFSQNQKNLSMRKNFFAKTDWLESKRNLML